MTELEDFINEMRSTSSATDKIDIIKRSSAFIHDVLEATYNPYKQYYVTSKTCKKNKGKFKYNTHKDVFSLLNDLTNRVYTGHDAIHQVNGFEMATAYGHNVYKIIDKDLGIRAGAKVINKAVPGLIPEFNVVLAQEFKGKCDWSDEWYVSRKLDGVRCIARVDSEGNCSLFSRTGKEFTTLNKVKEAIEDTGIISTTFDGEICLVDEDGNEDFQGVMKQLRRKDHQIKNPAYMVFDMLRNDEFDSGKGTEPLKTRLLKCRSWVRNNLAKSLIESKCDILRFTDQTLITGEDHFEHWKNIECKDNWEGLMLRKNVGYEGKRTKNLVKVKKFHDAEYEVIDVDFDNHEVVRDGKSETIKMLSQVWIEHKGHKVKVGSGFTQNERMWYTENYLNESIVGKIITVQYFEETKNDKGGISLRFPTVKVIHGDKREM